MLNFLVTAVAVWFLLPVVALALSILAALFAETLVFIERHPIRRPLFRFRFPSWSKRVTAVFAAVMLWVGMIPVQPTAVVSFVALGGIAFNAATCTPSQIENMVNTILQEATGIIAVADPGATWLADFSKATALLKVDEANWIKGGVVQDMINVLIDLQGVCALISALVPYANLVAVLVAGIVQVLSLLLPPPPAPVAMRAMAERPNPWIGVRHVSSVKDSKDQWHAICKANPALAMADFR